MTRRRLTAVGAVAAAALTGAACGDTTNTGVTELNLDRPVDVSFACYGQMKLAGGQLASANTAMPTVVCDRLSPQVTPRDGTGAAAPATPYPGQEGVSQPPSWYGFILQSASGTVALTTWPVSPADSLFATGSLPQQVSDTPTSLFQVLDADPLTPGKNALSVGEDPVAIATDKTGCFEVTANAGSCDLSEIEINSTLANIVDGNPDRPKIYRVPVVMGPDHQQIRAKPAAMVAEPFLGTEDMGSDTVGQACPVAASSKVYIAYPSCNLVAEVKLAPDATGMATAEVVGGIKFDTNGVPRVITPQTLAADLNCPVECTTPGGPAAGASLEGVRPVALDYRLDTHRNDVKPSTTSRLAIGSDIRGAPNAPALTVVDLQLAGDTAFDPTPGSALSIALDGSVGISALALTPQIGMGSNPISVGRIEDNVDDQGQYVYAVASDGTVRVVDVTPLPQHEHHECDTQVDARFLRGSKVTTRDLECLELGQPNLPRRPGAHSPGIELPGGAVANSVTIVKGASVLPRTIGTDGKPTTTPLAAQAGLLVGYFAFITASTGAVYIANVNDDAVSHDVNSTAGHTIETSPVLVMPHQLRDSLSSREDVPSDCTSADGKLGAFAGGPRLTTAPVQQSVANTLPDDLRFQLPRLQGLECVSSNTAVTALEFGAPEVRASAAAGPAPSRDLAYPDLASVTAEGWTLTYEGTLALDNTVGSLNGPQLRFGQAFVDRTGMFFEDASRPFCSMGVEVGDIVELRGCNPANLDSDCPSGYTCYVHPQSTVGVGACFLKSEATRLQDTCRDFLSSVRRYTVGKDESGGTAPGKLVLWQRKHELSTTPIDGCVNDDQCDDLARAAVVLNQSADPFTEAAAGTPVTQRPTHWSCLSDPLRKQLGTDPGGGKRCVQACTPKASPNDAPTGPSCANGMICAPDPTSVTGGVCMEGIEPPQACLNGPQRYVVRAGEAFTVIGDHSGFIHPIIQSPDGSNRCVADPKLASDPLSIGRIPLNPPACGPVPTDPLFAADYPLTGRIDATHFEANPCSLTVPQLELDQTYPDAATAGGYGSCRGPTPASANLTSRQLSAIKFRNRSLTLTIVDPFRDAAQTCLKRDPVDTQTQAPIPSKIPLVVPGYQLSFAVKGGYLPITVALLGQVSPVKVVRGPSESIWVIDDGDVLPLGFDVSTRGQVFRIESVPPPSTDGSITTIINTLR